MPALALVLWCVLGLVAVAGRALLQRRWTGSWGIAGISGRPLSAEWLGGALFVAANGTVIAATVLDLVGTLDPVAALDRPWTRAVGLVLFAAGLAALVAAQLAMGASWRIGVSEAERTDLVTHGPFAIVRNPIYSAMVLAVGGLVLLSPSALALAAWAALLVSLELQVRLVEEPYLLRTHGAAYARYASRVGRLLPGVGRLGPPS